MMKTELSPSQDLLCGAFAGVTARMVIAPLDVVKIRFQVQSETRGLYSYSSVGRAISSIIRAEGLRALWKGNVPALLMVCPYAAIQLASFYQIKPVISASIPEPYCSLSVGAVSASLATLTTYPLDLLRTRLAAQSEPKQYRNIGHAVVSIIRSDGLSGLYAGLQPTLVEIVPYMALHFALYERTKAAVLQRFQKQHLSPVESMTIGAAAGTISKLTTLPLDNAKKVMQVQSQFQFRNTCATTERYRGVIHVLHSLWRKQGLTAWFRGASPSLLKAAPNSAVTFMVYESAKRYITSG